MIHNLREEGIILFLKKIFLLKKHCVVLCFNIDHLSGKSYTKTKNSKVVSPNTRTSINNLKRDKRGNNIGKLDIIFIIDFPEDFNPEIKKKLEEILI